MFNGEYIGEEILATFVANTLRYTGVPPDAAQTPTEALASGDADFDFELSIPGQRFRVVIPHFQHFTTRLVQGQPINGDASGSAPMPTEDDPQGFQLLETIVPVFPSSYELIGFGPQAKDFAKSPPPAAVDAIVTAFAKSAAEWDKSTLKKNKAARLTELSISNCTIRTRTLKTLFSAAPVLSLMASQCLKKIVLTNVSMDDEGLASLLSSVHQQKAVRLEELWISGNAAVTDASAATIATHCPGLRFLNVSQTGFTAKGICSLFASAACATAVFALPGAPAASACPPAAGPHMHVSATLPPLSSVLYEGCPAAPTVAADGQRLPTTSMFKFKDVEKAAEALPVEAGVQWTVSDCAAFRHTIA